MSGALPIHIMINVYDIETYEDESNVVPYCICFLLNSKTYSIYYEEGKNLILESLNIIVENKNFIIEFYIHNLNFDGILIINEISKNNIKYSIMTNKTNIYYLEIYYLNKIIRFRCSYKLLPLPLNKIGELENFSKTFFPYKFVNKNTLFYVGPVPKKEYWENNEQKLYTKAIFDLKKETIEYCMNDVLLTYKFLSNIIPIINNESKKLLRYAYSAASISHKLFYQKYNDKLIAKKILKKDETYIRNAYFGGRCEVFGNIKENEHIKYFDFAGMYSQCMLENFHNGPARYTLNSDFTVPGFHTVEYESSIEFLPVLPSHSETSKLIFANGKGTGTFWFEELMLFVQKGGKINKVVSSYIYEKYEKVFSSFINNFNLIKEKGGYYKVFGKLMINSLYGSMALKSESEFFYITFSEAEFFNILEKMNVSYFYKVNLSYIIIIKDDYKSKNYFKNKNNISYSNRNVSYSAAIAAKARIKLYRAMEEVISDGGRLLYCDTDSIFAAYNLKDKRINAKSFSWIEFYDDGVFIAPKTYALKSKKEEIKLKGISTKNIKFEEIKKNFYEERDIIFKDQLTFNKFNFILKQNYNSKKISINDYDKRTFINNKSSTKPLLACSYNG